MNNDANAYEYEREASVTSGLLTLYNVIDWIDFGLVIAIILYVGNAAQGIDSASFADSMFELPPSVVGLLLCVVSLVVSVSAVIVSRMIYKQGANRSMLRLIGRYIIWGIWIPVDIYFIYVYAAGLLRA